MANTSPVVTSVSLRDGQVTFDTSDLTSRMNFTGLVTPLILLDAFLKTRSRRCRGISGKLAGAEGLEPPTSGFGDRRSSQLSYAPTEPRQADTVRRRMVQGAYKECAEVDVKCNSSKWLRSAPNKPGARLIHRRWHWENLFGAGDGNRTRTASLEGWDSTIELHPHSSRSLSEDLVEGVGFEPT